MSPKVVITLLSFQIQYKASISGKQDTPLGFFREKLEVRFRGEDRVSNVGEDSVHVRKILQAQADHHHP